MTPDRFSELALSFDNVIASSHFNRTAFKVANKKIFATLHEESRTANLKLSPADQSVFCLINKEIIFPVNNKWGLKGWTTFDLEKIDSKLMLEALDTAYQESIKASRKK